MSQLVLNMSQLAGGAAAAERHRDCKGGRTGARELTNILV